MLLGRHSEEQSDVAISRVSKISRPLKGIDLSKILSGGAVYNLRYLEIAALTSFRSQ